MAVKITTFRVLGTDGTIALGAKSFYMSFSGANDCRLQFRQSKQIKAINLMAFTDSGADLVCQKVVAKICYLDSEGNRLPFDFGTLTIVSSDGYTGNATVVSCVVSSELENDNIESNSDIWGIEVLSIYGQLYDAAASALRPVIDFNIITEA